MSQPAAGGACDKEEGTEEAPEAEAAGEQVWSVGSRYHSSQAHPIAASRGASVCVDKESAGGEEYDAKRTTSGWEGSRCVQGVGRAGFENGREGDGGEARLEKRRRVFQADSDDDQDD